MQEFFEQPLQKKGKNKSGMHIFVCRSVFKSDCNFNVEKQSSKKMVENLVNFLSYPIRCVTGRLEQRLFGFHNNLLLSLIKSFLAHLQLINSEMPRRIYDEQYINEKELKKGHTFISLKKRLKLIQLVFKEKLTIYKAAKRLKICHPTAKFIIKSYRKGKIYEYDGDSFPIRFEENIRPSADGTSPEIQNPEVVVQPSLQNHTQTAQNQCEMTLCMANYWTTVDNQIVVLPFYYYQ